MLQRRWQNRCDLKRGFSSLFAAGTDDRQIGFGALVASLDRGLQVGFSEFAIHVRALERSPRVLPGQEVRLGIARSGGFTIQV